MAVGSAFERVECRTERVEPERQVQVQRSEQGVLFLNKVGGPMS